MRSSKPRPPTGRRTARRLTTLLAAVTLAAVAVAVASLTSTAAQASRPPNQVSDRNATVFG